MFKFIKFTIRNFLGIDSEEYESLLANQELILERLNKLEEVELENKSLLKDGKEKSYSDYLTLKNLLIILIILCFIGGGFWIYNSEYFNTSTLESIKDLGSLSKDLHSIELDSILKALKKLNESSVNLSKEELKILLEIKNLLLKKGIDENPLLKRSVNLGGSFKLLNPLPVDNYRQDL